MIDARLVLATVLSLLGAACGEECALIEVRGNFVVPDELNVLYFRIDDPDGQLVTGDNREVSEALPASLGICKGARTPSEARVSVTGYLGTVDRADPVAQSDRVPLSFEGSTVSLTLIAF